MKGNFLWSPLLSPCKLPFLVNHDNPNGKFATIVLKQLYIFAVSLPVLEVITSSFFNIVCIIIYLQQGCICCILGSIAELWHFLLVVWMWAKNKKLQFDYRLPQLVLCIPTLERLFCSRSSCTGTVSLHKYPQQLLISIFYHPSSFFPLPIHSYLFTSNLTFFCMLYP